MEGFIALVIIIFVVIIIFGIIRNIQIQNYMEREGRDNFRKEHKYKFIRKGDVIKTEKCRYCNGTGYRPTYNDVPYFPCSCLNGKEYEYATEDKRIIESTYFIDKRTEKVVDVNYRHSNNKGI